MTAIPTYLPNNVGGVLLGLAIALIVAAFFAGGTQIGPVKVPESAHSRWKLLFSGLALTVLTLCLYLMPLTMFYGFASCPKDFRNYEEIPSTSFSCKCSDDLVGGSVTGTLVYTSDSSVCSAAKHAGAFTEKNKKIKIKARASCESYAASERNGINSLAHDGRYYGAFYFPRISSGVCN